MMERESSEIEDRPGRATIDDARRMKRSKRAADGKLTVALLSCPRCGHHKALLNQTTIRCSRCGYERPKG